MSAPMIRWILVLSVLSTVACNSIPAPDFEAIPAPPGDGWVRIAGEGATDVQGRLGNDLVSARITTREVDIVGDPWPEQEDRLSNCTYSRKPCSLVDNLKISVNEHELSVPRSVFADLADVNWAHLREGTGDRILLTLKCGDASESYTVEITLDRQWIGKRELFSNFDGQLLSRSVYYQPKVYDN